MDLLKQLGLTDNEIKLYTELLRRGESKTGPLIKTLGISSSRAYASLHELVKKGLVTYYEKNAVRHYQAQSPELLIEYTKNLQQQAQKAVKELSQLALPETSANKSALFEGFNGYKQAFEILLEQTADKTELLTLGFSPRTYAFETLRNYLRTVDAKRIENKTPMRILLPTETKSTIGKDREQEAFTRVRYLPQGYISPVALSIFKDYVIHWVWSELDVTAFLVKNREVAEGFRNHFEFLWKQAKK